MQEKAGEQGAAYIPMPKGRGFTPHFDNWFCLSFLQLKQKIIFTIISPPAPALAKTAYFPTSALNIISNLYINTKTRILQ